MLRAEVGPITIGPDTNLQDLTVVHADPDHPVHLRACVTIGHRVVVHGCRIDDDALVGMGATILDDAHVGARAVVGANALVIGGHHRRPRHGRGGAPARPRDLALPDAPRENVAAYLRLADWYRQALD